MRVSGAVMGVAATALAVALTLVPAALASARPKASYAIAAVFPPWWSEARVTAVAESLGQVAGRGALDNIVVLYGDAGLQARAEQSGALFLLDPTVPGACR